MRSSDSFLPPLNFKASAAADEVKPWNEEVSFRDIVVEVYGEDDDVVAPTEMKATWSVFKSFVVNCKKKQRKTRDIKWISLLGFPPVSSQ